MSQHRKTAAHTLAVVGALVCIVLSATTLQSQELLAPTKNTPAQQELVAPQSIPATNSISTDASDSLNKLVTALVLKNLPHSYTRDKDWGKQKERWDGLKIERDGLRIKTKRRKKLVNHGSWKKYSAELIDAKNQFDVSVTNVRQTPAKKLAFQINFATRVKLHARQAKWVKGVQMYSLSADGHATIRLSVDMELGISLMPGDFPPDVKFEPRALSADLIVDDFRIDRVSKLGGEFAQMVTRLARKELDSEIEEKEIELVEKINKEIAEESDKLQLSLSDALKSKWADQAKPFLPDEILKASDK